MNRGVMAVLLAGALAATLAVCEDARAWVPGPLGGIGPLPVDASGVDGAGFAEARDMGQPETVRDPDPLPGLLALSVPDSSQVEEAFEALDEGLDLWRDGDEAEGARAVDAALARLPAAADWRPLIRAELLAPTGDSAGVRSALAELDPGTGFQGRWGWAFLVDAYEAAGDTTGARQVAEAAARDRATPDSGGAGWLRSGRLALAEADTVAAVERLERAIGAGGPGSSSARSAARLLDDLVEPADLADPEAMGRVLLAGREWARAHRHLAPVLLLESARLDEQEHWELRIGLGQALVELNRTREAEQTLAPLADVRLPPELAARALYWTGRAVLARGERDQATRIFVQIAREAPGSSLAEEGLLRVLDDISSDGRTGASAAASRDRAMDALFQVGVGSTSGELAAVRFGTERYLAGDYGEAATIFERYLDGSRRGATRQQAAYWAALAHDRQGNRERTREFLHQVHRENPLSFYGTFAGERLEAPVLPADVPPGPSAVPGMSHEIANALIRLRIHQRVPTAGSFDHELSRLEGHFLARGDAAYDFAEALIEGGLPIQGIVLGRTIHRAEGEWNLRLLRIVHPFPYREHIVREARAQGLDPFFVAGLIRQESMFHPTIRSVAGAVGLMQLLPGTARDVARAEGIRYSPGALGDPVTNLRLGTAFLAAMVQRFDGRAEDALSAYNAGPTRINQWRTRPEYRDTQVFLEHIPFQETRHYVKVVQQYTRIYTALYGCGHFEACAGLSYQAAVARSSLAGGAPSSSLAR